MFNYHKNGIAFTKNRSSIYITKCIVKFTFCTSSFNQNFLMLGPASAGLFSVNPKKLVINY